MEKKTGIFKNERDKTQPYRVYWQGYIIFFAKTKDEAVREFAREKARHK